MKEKVMLITGATSGIGKAAAIKAGEAGLKLILTGRQKKQLDELVEKLGADNVFAMTADATDYDALKKVVEQGVKHWGQLDVVFANAGVGVSKAGVEKGDPKEWNQLIDVNVKALLWTAQLTLPHLRTQKGHFLLTSSAAGRAQLKGSVYGASKWFAYGFGLNLAAEIAEWGGRCTTICPGMVNTPFFDEAKPDKLDPDDVADAVLYAVTAQQKNNVREIYLMPNS